MSNVEHEESKGHPELQEYVAPALRVLGDVRQLTLGGSDGSGDSGNPGAQQF